MNTSQQDIAEGILFTDQYQFTMAQLYFRTGMHEKIAQFDYFFREYPNYGAHKAGYCVNAGLEWAIHQNQFRPAARKVILLFGDAPPHAADHDYCLRLASEFRRKYHGVVSTVTCHSAQRLPAFIEIAQMGGGEAFLTRNEREIMTQLIILVFGSKYREKVLEAFHLLDR